MVSDEELEKQMLDQINNQRIHSRMKKGLLLIPTLILAIYLPTIFMSNGYTWLGIIADVVLVFIFLLLTSSSSRPILRTKAASPLVYDKSELRADWDNEKN